MDVCNCGNPVVERTSWTALNPGRRFHSCANLRAAGGCNYFIWIDPPACDRCRNIIPGLIRRINEMEAEIARRRTMEFRMWISAFVFVLGIFYVVLG